MLSRVILCISLLSLAACHAVGLTQKFDLVTLQIKGEQIQVQLADTPAKRRQGLMSQTPIKHGMLLLLHQPAEMVLWMKNTPEPLDVVFIDTDWRIVAIRSMQANTETSHPSETIVRAALEMPSGWFEKANIKPGDLLIYCPQQPALCQKPAPAAR